MKKIILSTSLIFSTFWFLLYTQAFRDLIRPIIGSSNIELLFNTFLFFVFLAPLTVLLLLLPNKYFSTWWKFAWFGLPLTISGIVYINLTYDSGLFGFGAGFDLLLFGACYIFFILGTLVQLVRAWWGVSL